ncbi:hypothetical protein NDU88_002165 [Pleurodeles waltl]|uniref:Uncharacterized protein n=1 Tax=Pleurodeles waltl TaxID=8319 RepID=A0AAV7NCW5_PLEWA|nr:hypothetical protein NDU88_002165 [Pleurodeles waltl]
MDQFTEQETQKEPSEQAQDKHEPSSAQILAAIEVPVLAVQTKIEAMALDVDLHAVTERSIKTEPRVSMMRGELETLKAMVAALKSAWDWLEFRGAEKILVTLKRSGRCEAHEKIRTTA